MTPRARAEAIVTDLLRVRKVIVHLCEPCIRGEGQECHTPGCALWMHTVDIPIGEELLEDADTALDAERARTLEEAAGVVEQHALPAHALEGFRRDLRETDDEGYKEACRKALGEHRLMTNIAAAIRALAGGGGQGNNAT